MQQRLPRRKLRRMPQPLPTRHPRLNLLPMRHQRLMLSQPRMPRPRFIPHRRKVRQPKRPRRALLPRSPRRSVLYNQPMQRRLMKRQRTQLRRSMRRQHIPHLRRTRLRRLTRLPRQLLNRRRRKKRSQNRSSRNFAMNRKAHGFPWAFFCGPKARWASIGGQATRESTWHSHFRHGLAPKMISKP